MGTLLFWRSVKYSKRQQKNCKCTVGWLLNSHQKLPFLSIIHGFFNNFLPFSHIINSLRCFPILKNNFCPLFLFLLHFLSKLWALTEHFKGNLKILQISIFGWNFLFLYIWKGYISNIILSNDLYIVRKYLLLLKNREKIAVLLSSYFALIKILYILFYNIIEQNKMFKLH